jgi:hypothetical protein
MNKYTHSHVMYIYIHICVYKVIMNQSLGKYICYICGYLLYMWIFVICISIRIFMNIEMYIYIHEYINMHIYAYIFTYIYMYL